MPRGGKPGWQAMRGLAEREPPGHPLPRDQDLVRALPVRPTRPSALGPMGALLAAPSVRGDDEGDTAALQLCVVI